MNGKSRHAVYSKNLDENNGKIKQQQAAGAKPFTRRQSANIGYTGT